VFLFFIPSAAEIKPFINKAPCGAFICLGHKVCFLNKDTLDLSAFNRIGSGFFQDWITWLFKGYIGFLVFRIIETSLVFLWIGSEF